MAGEEVEGEFSPAQPDQTGRSQVVEGSVGSAAPARAPSWYEQDLPYEELVGNIRQLIEQARARHQRGHPDAPFRANEPFEPAEWLGWYLRKEVGRHVDGSQTQRQIFDLSNAWDALFSDRYPSDNGLWRDWVKGELSYRAGEMKQAALTLPPRSVTLLDAMAEAAGLPRQRGEATIDLTPFAHAAETPRAQPRENKTIPRRPQR
jgi:hypothetical protein